eukprot:4549314-Prymnesium_polylepis.1
MAWPCSPSLRARQPSRTGSSAPAPPVSAMLAALLLSAQTKALVVPIVTPRTLRVAAPVMQFDEEGGM